MSIAEHIRISLELPQMIVERYLEDLSDAELLLRPGPGMNHIAWQLGHLITGENFHVNQIAQQEMPELPEGFAARHTDATALHDAAEDFYPKATYLEQMHRQRAGTLEVLASMDDDALMAESPEAIRYFGPTVGSVFSGEAIHWMMHAGQWAVVRRRLGRAPLF